MNCDKCGSENTHSKGKTLHQGVLKKRFLCKDCGKPFYVACDNTEQIEGWNQATIADAEAKRGNVPEIGLEENLQGLEVTGVTYLKKDLENRLHWVKTRTKSIETNILESLTVKLCERIPAAPTIPGPKITDSELLTQITISDLHVGMRSWAEETGANYDLDICKSTITKAVDIALEQSPNSEIGLLMELGDFFHRDGHEAVTPEHRNLLDVDSRYQKMLEVGEDIVLETIDKMLLKYRLVKVIIASGNHDPSTSDTLRSLIRRYYRQNERLEVIGSANPFYAYKHGSTLIGCHHGNLKKRIAMPAHFSQYFSGMWGSTTYRYLHTGHLHCTHEQELGGALTLQHATLAAPDAYAAHRFDRTLRSIGTITYSSKYGMLYRSIIPIELVYDRVVA